MATILGARAVSLEKEIGSLEAGKRADLIAVSLDQPHAAPMYDVYSQLVYALKASDVGDVMVNGRWIVRERRSLTLDWPAIAAKAGEFAPGSRPASGGRRSTRPRAGSAFGSPCRP